MTSETLKKCMPFANDEDVERFAAPLTNAMDYFGITTRRQQAAFLASIAHESGSLKYVREIASGEAYEGRKDLGNINHGDGTKYKGRGLIQVTGRANYKEASTALNYNFIKYPEDMELPGPAAFTAAWFWDSRGLNELADKDDFLGLSKKINGVNKDGKPNHWTDRLAHWLRIKKALGVDDLIRKS